MDILGVEIDPSFVYRVDAGIGYDSGLGYLYAFTIHFKDGKSYGVKLDFNMYASDSFRGALVRDNNIDRRKVKNIEKRKKEAKEKLGKIRNELIKQMNEMKNK